MTSRISQLISVVGGVKSDTTAQISELIANVTQEGLTSGILRTYRARFEEADQSAQATALAAMVGSAASVRPPEEATRVQVNAEDTLARIETLLTRRFDVTRTLDEANAEARADVKVGGTVLWAQVPTSHLLWLERELADLHEKVSVFPVLDQAEVWSDEGTEQGVWRTEPAEVASTKKVPFNHVLSKATPEHAANVQVMTRDEVVGWKVTTKFSGALDLRRKRQLLDRLVQAREAVKYAREEANSAEVQDSKEAKRFFDWWLRS